MLVKLFVLRFLNDASDAGKSSAGVLGVAIDRTVAHRVDPLSDATTDVERVVSQAQGVLTNAREAFALLHETIFPDADRTGGIREMLQAFNAMEHPLYNFGRAKVADGIETAFTMGLAHEEISEANLQKIAASMPRKADGSRVSLRPLRKVGRQYASALIETIEKSKSTSDPSPSAQPADSSKPSESAQARAS